jgi:hypothetical protein
MPASATTHELAILLDDQGHQNLDSHSSDYPPPRARPRPFHCVAYLEKARPSLRPGPRTAIDLLRCAPIATALGRAGGAVTEAVIWAADARQRLGRWRREHARQHRRRLGARGANVGRPQLQRGGSRPEAPRGLAVSAISFISPIQRQPLLAADRLAATDWSSRWGCEVLHSSRSVCSTLRSERGPGRQQ